MAFDFVVETPQKRGINRNNYKLIQKRATQAGARTRARLHSNPQYFLSLGKQALPRESESTSDKCSHTYPAKLLVINGALAADAHPPFASRFGEGGRLICTTDRVELSPAAISPAPNISALQAKLFTNLASSTNIVLDANQAFKVFNLTQTQILQQLPSRYGQIRFLDHAIECLISRLHSCLPALKLQSSGCGDVSSSQLYGKALFSLRSAIEHIHENQLTEIWFATLLLTLSELLTGDNQPGWIWHAAGAARLLYKIGPTCIVTEFQLSLLPIQWKNMVIETIIGNKPCYLSDPEWQAALRRSALDNGSKFSLRSRCSVEIWCLGANIPGLFRYVADHSYGRPACDHSILKKTLTKLSSRLSEWEEMWETELLLVLDDLTLKGTLHYDAKMIMLAYYMLSMLLYRLRIALDPCGNLHLEVRVLEMCAGVAQMRDTLPNVVGEGLQQDLISSRFALGTEKTSRVWREEILNASPGTPIDALVFDEWCDAIGRAKIPFSFTPCYSPGSTPYGLPFQGC